MTRDTPAAAYTPRPPPLVPPASAASEGLLPLKPHQHARMGQGSGSSSGSGSGGCAAPVAAVAMGGGGSSTLSGGGGGGGLISTTGDVVLPAAATSHVAAAVGVAGAADPNGRFVWATDGSRQPWRPGDAPRGVVGLPAVKPSSFV
ncbi:hypothetical protein CHLRE_03g200450v5 [Chlamydomonas reinhardtii]|uniref:Uncharacterized protein n=1 Tax=Chlamydomonas reinhardtii TaxID=3055 RepID=A0A2K3DZG8_CHLRE|nr:uncharacterized protein CHLRE_03g200450v5 [Chlamydomonas reinhardtii]XP_042926580.1 uncharacterized protein CHLRE_03g200450v5 [Chlamydomonas reinhardtii]PNW85908.1 hypothetical protein CHLRE_03g200450v5 [Chlamydomonas reinhardtii]PNW85909.1 hypothetical protein CHLRE_03g200450v5 [Chlamydomonas reinhardtii]